MIIFLLFITVIIFLYGKNVISDEIKIDSSKIEVLEEGNIISALNVKANIPNKKIVGISKLSRTLEKFCRRLQNLERITNQVADYLQSELGAKGVGVVLKARHLCMEMRGVKKSDTHTVTCKLLGYYRTDERTRAEFLNLIGNHRN